jgi:hypothetical protein
MLVLDGCLTSKSHPSLREYRDMRMPLISNIMKINIKNLKGEVFSVEIDPSQTVIPH